ncbi:EAL domain-containing protein [Niallia circulans]|uniref:EAL domain-containing protein n=1 Tax=Niallia circulans TaxID=1397 RepID=A0A941GS39_NIACI|nr:EAL domain-containing protein [Niallia circulans]MCB5239832.1 EAL domain-containing protein [Niallia circulans]
MINILLVDDRSENLLALEAIIEQKDYNLIKAHSGEEALKYLLKHDFAVILLDVQMPGIDGFGTAKIIKAREKTKNIPILFITANNMDSEHIFKGYSLGAIDYILKPFDPIILKAKVERLVELYKMNQMLTQQAERLEEKRIELEKANKELTRISSDLLVSEALANVISETSIDSMLVLDKDGAILKVNPTVERMFLFQNQELHQQNINILFSSEKARKYINSILTAIHTIESINGDETSKEVVLTRKDGTTFPAEIQFGKRYVQEKSIVACTIRDITKKKEDERQITYMAYHDGLTDLPNRRLFNHQLMKLVNKAKDNFEPLALLYLDMDRFKYINDSLGHLIGDRLLIEISKLLTRCMRHHDFVARVGGDEFNIILPNTNRETALESAENILNEFKKPLYVDNYELFITTSIGISIFPYDGEDSTILTKNADAALYRAKEAGKNQYNVFHSGMNLQSYRKFIMQNDLRNVLERDELKLVYQPKLSLKTNQINGAEALIRWEHPNWGTIMPSEFIPLAEEIGVIIDIGEWVFRTACEQIKEWEKKGITPIRLAVNFSARQFLQKKLAAKLEAILMETETDPSFIEIEITESVLLGNETIITKLFHHLKTLGIHLTIDDFGTGYSSLNYLRRFPFQTLKIDKSFIHDLSNKHAEGVALARSIISLAKALDMSVVAEGVETKEQLMILKELHCQEIQGYLFSTPVTSDKLEYLLKETRDNTAFKNNHLVDSELTLVQMTNTSPINGSLDANQEILTAALRKTKQSYSLSNREMDVFELIVQGLSNKEISDKLFISEHTVKNHITRIFQKLMVNDRLQAMAKVYNACIEEGKIRQA